MKKTLPLLFAIFFFNITKAQTTILGGVVSGTWTKAASPYLIQGNLLIANGTTLSIEPGVRVNFNGSYKLLVSGRLVATGNAADSIFFAAVNTTIGWQGIRFENTPSTNDSSRIAYCSIKYGYVNDNGGGVYVSNFSKITISNNSITNCIARGGCGGAIYMAGSNATIRNNNLSFNHSIAGAICIMGGSPLIDNNIISYNDYTFPPLGEPGDPGSDPDIWGGGISCNNADAIITNNTITNNSSRLYGGGICAIDGNVNISNNIISDNVAPMFGGGIYSTAHGSISNNTISNNISNNSGGGVYYYPASGTTLVNKNIIRNNIAAYSGGGYTCNGQCILTNNLLSNNAVSAAGAEYQGGGAIWFVGSGSGTVFSGNILCNNSSVQNGGAIACYSANPTLTNNTVVNNSAANGGALYCSSSSPSLVNMILTGNTASGSGQQVFLYNDVSDPSITYSDIAGGSAGIEANGNFYTGTYENNIDANPLFVSPSAGSGTGFNGTLANWNIQNASPVINKGMPGGNYPANDYAGKMRVMNGVIDMGAFENQVPVAPTVIVSGGGRVCSGSPLPDIVFNFTYGNFPITLQYRINGVAQPAITGINSLQYTIQHAAAGVYSIALVKDTFLTGTGSGEATVTVVNPSANFKVNNGTQCEKTNSFSFTNQSTITNDTIASIQWDFGDSTFSTLLNPSHSYAKPGIYNVQLIIAGNTGCADSATRKDTVVSFNINTLADSLRTYQDSVILDAGAGFATYIWSNGESGQKTTARQSGWFKVSVTNSYGCTASDSIYVNFRKNKTLSIDNVANLCSNATFDVPVRGKNLTNIVGMQGAISWDAGVLKLDTIIYANTPINFKETDINFTKRPNGYITYLWNDVTVSGKSIADNASIFTLRFSKRVSNTSAFSSQVMFNSAYAAFEIDTLNLVTNMPVATSELAYFSGMLSFRPGPVTTDVYLSECDSVIYNGKVYFDSTTVYDTLKLSGSECDSLYRRVHISIYHGGVEPTVSIYASQSTITYGQAVTFYTNYNTAAGLYPSFQWFKNGVAIPGQNGDSFTATLLNAGDTIFASLKSSYSCVPVDSVISNKLGINVFYTISGSFFTPGTSAIKNVAVNVTGTNATTVNTNSGNSFTVSLLGGPQTKYILKPIKSSETTKANGVSTLDIAIIQNHILNTNKFTSPYQWVAADVNGSNTVSSLDILLIKRFILGLDNTFSGNRLWAFIDSLNGGLNTSNPLPYKDSVTFTSLLSNKTNVRFSGVRLGDVNFDWNASLQKPIKESVKPVIFYNDDVVAKNGEEIRVPVKVKNFKNVLGMQFTLNFNDKNLHLLKIVNNRLNLQYATNRIGEGKIAFIWNDDHNKTVSLNDGDVLFEIIFNKVSSFDKESLSVTSDVTNIELWDGEFVKHNIIMTAGKIISTTIESSITKDSWDVTPNLTGGEVTLSFKMLKGTKLNVILLNSGGQKVLSKNITAPKGISTANINLKQATQLEAGVYFIKIPGINDGSIKKVVLIK